MAKRNKKAGRPKLKAKAVKPTPKRQSAGKSKKTGQKQGNSTPSHLLPPKGLDFNPLDLKKLNPRTPAEIKKLIAEDTKRTKAAIKAIEKQKKEAAKALKGKKNIPPFVAINLRNQ